MENTESFHDFHDQLEDSHGKLSGCVVKDLTDFAMAANIDNKAYTTSMNNL